MRFSLKALALASGLAWGGAILFTGALNLRRSSYGRPFLRMMSTLYPGYKASRTGKDVLVGTGYAVLDGAMTGLVFGAVYNAIADSERVSSELLDTRAA